MQTDCTTIRTIEYTRWMGRNFILSGEIIEEREVQLKRYPGVVVIEYRVKTDMSKTNLSYHWVNEQDVLDIKEVLQ